MKNPRRTQVKNQKYLKKWTDYINNLPQGQAALLPLIVDLKNYKITRNLMNGCDVKPYFDNHHADIPSYISQLPMPHPSVVADNYHAHFCKRGGGGVESRPNNKATPLDIVTNGPTFFLFKLGVRDKKDVWWRFTPEMPFSTVNDPTDLTRNCEIIGLMDEGRSLLVYNRCRSNIADLKYNLHITIYEPIVDEAGKPIKGPNGETNYETDIIIDPGIGNSGSWPN